MARLRDFVAVTTVLSAKCMDFLSPDSDSIICELDILNLSKFQLPYQVIKMKPTP